MTPLVLIDGGAVTVTQILVALINVFWAALVGAGVLVRKQYENRLTDKEGEISDRDERIGKYEAADDARRQMSDRTIQALEQAVGIAKAQNEMINIVVEKHGALLAKIVDRQDEAKETATRRARP